MRAMRCLLPLLALLLAGCIPHPRDPVDTGAPPPPPPASPNPPGQPPEPSSSDIEPARPDTAPAGEQARDGVPPGPEAPPPGDATIGTAALPGSTVAPDALGPSAAQADIPPQVAPARPAWTAKPVTPDAVEIAATNYAVRPGDTLRHVAEVTGAGSEAIARENGLDAPFVIKAGQTLKIPGGRYHRVLAGQSGIAIARAYGVAWSSVVALNHLVEPYVLRTDMRLLIPTREEVHAMTPEAQAAAFKLDVDDLITGSEPALPAHAAPAQPVQSAAEPVPATVAVAEPKRFGGRFAWPLIGPILVKFGPYGSGGINQGIDIGARDGDPVYAAADGVVAYVGNEIAVYGGLILLKHGDGWITTYGHASQLLVTRGQAVKKGQLIARAGMTGSAREPKLHFEIREGRKPVNPLQYLPPRESGAG